MLKIPKSPELKAERKKSNNFRHGHTSGGRSPEFRCWLGMRIRCHYPNKREWKWYGGRGITVCERWRQSFENFLADMGPKPSPEHTLDRINNDGNYEPGNCRWATEDEQRANKRPRSVYPKRDLVTGRFYVENPPRP